MDRKPNHMSRQQTLMSIIFWQKWIASHAYWHNMLDTVTMISGETLMDMKSVAFTDRLGMLGYMLCLPTYWQKNAKANLMTIWHICCISIYHLPYTIFKSLLELGIENNPDPICRVISGCTCPLATDGCDLETIVNWHRDTKCQPHWQGNRPRYRW